MPETLKLMFGYNPVPTDAVAAWGARWIVTQDGYIDQVPDRMSTAGPKPQVDKLLGHLNTVVLMQPRKKLAELLRSGEVHTRRAFEVELYRDDKVTVVGNTNASAGYFYVTAYTTKEIA